ncbi:MAG: helix-turn-helix domain-containing protein [Pseudonocardiaceae bacterium]
MREGNRLDARHATHPRPAPKVHRRLGTRTVPLSRLPHGSELMNGDIGREHWTVPAQGMTSADPDGMVQLVACHDGSVALQLNCSGRKVGVRFDVSRAAQLSTGVWEAAQLAQQLKNSAGDDRSRPPPRPPARSTGCAEPASNLAIAPSSRSTAPGQPHWSIGEGLASGNEGAGMDADEARTIGRRIRQVRNARGKSLRVTAGLAGAGLSRTKLQRIELGLRAVTLPEIRALAEALHIAPSELTKLPVPAPANGNTDSAINSVFLALMATNRNRPGGQILPVEVLRDRVAAMVDAHCRCDRGNEVGAALPALIRDLHTSIAAGRDVAELLELAVQLHSQATVAWLRVAGATIELREMAAGLATRAAQDRDTPEARALAAYGGLYVLVTAGATDLAWAELDSVSVPTRTPEGMQLAGMLGLCRSFLAAVDSRPGDVHSPLEYAAELAERTGELNAYGLGFGSQEVGRWRALAALESGDHELAARLAEGLSPETHPLRSGQADYWVTYGRALSRLRGRHEDSVKAFRRAELISPHHVLRNPITRDVLAELLTRMRLDSPAGRELRKMAYRAGLPV